MHRSRKTTLILVTHDRDLAALADVRSGRTLPVPEHLRDASYKGAERLGHGKGYQYSHDGEGHFVPQNYLTEARRYYEPTEQGVEKKIKERLDRWRALTAEAEPTWQSVLQLFLTFFPLSPHVII